MTGELLTECEHKNLRCNQSEWADVLEQFDNFWTEEFILGIWTVRYRYLKIQTIWNNIVADRMDQNTKGLPTDDRLGN